MHVGFVLSNLGGSPLQVGLERGLIELGHKVTYGTQECDVRLVFNQCAHDTGYVYPEFPDDRTPIAFIDTAEYGPRSYGKHADYWNAFAAASMVHDTKSCAEQHRLKRWLEGRSFPYFVREFYRDVEFPPAYHPIDYPLPQTSQCARRPNRDEYLSRTVPVACLWGESNQGRVPISAALRTIPGADVYVIERDGPRLPQREYFRRIEAARCSVNFDGYGSSSFRLPEVLVRTVLLRGPLRIRMREPLIGGETCVDFAVFHETLPNDLLHWQWRIMDNPEWAFSVYERGYDHCMTHYTEKATAQYVIDTIERHDWSKPTCL